MFNHFYHRLLRKYVTIFGTLFNNLFVTRYTTAGVVKETIKVPLAYGPKEKFLLRIKSDPTLTKSIATTVPRMSFEITGLGYDADRTQQTTLKYQGLSSGSNTNSSKTSYVAAPYNINFTLSVYTRNIEDGTQIAEQIMPYFQPDYVVTATLIPALSIKKDIPIILNAVNQTIDYEGGLDTTRLVIWNFDFTLRGYFFGPVANTSIIMGSNEIANTGGAIANIYQDSEIGSDQIVTVAASGHGTYHEGETVRARSGAFGTVVSWNESLYRLSISDRTDAFQVGNTLTGDISHAVWVVSALSVVPLKNVKMTMRQTPLSANSVDSDFGYSESLYEFPNIPS